jgi:cytochrome c oxidase subunit 2
MIYFLVRYRRSRNPVPEEIHGSWIIEVLWTLIPTILVLTMFFYGLTSFQFLRTVPSDSIKIIVHSRQWAWLFEYANGKKSPDLVVPVGKNVKLELTSDDVIHGFYVPDYRIQQDTVPGIKREVWFNATTTGTHDIFCAQYCGLKHSSMTANLIAVDPDKFNSWLKGENINLPSKVKSEEMPVGEKLIFERGCVSCHSLSGEYMVGPTFKGMYNTKRSVKTNGKLHDVIADDNYIRDSIIFPANDIVDGYPNTMPSGRDILSDDEINKIIDYIKTLK